MATFKKLFTIRYNNKEFLILVSDEHRYTFLEVVGDDKYSYPEYEDFKELNEMYNNVDRRVLPRIKRMSYDEKVRYESTLLALLIAANSVALAYVVKLGLDLQKTYNQYQVVLSSQAQYKQIFDRSNIDIYFDGRTITRDDVIAAIDNNGNFDELLKEKAIEVMDINIEKDPDVNLRIYYENMKGFRGLVIDKDDVDDLNWSGNADTVNKQIHIRRMFYDDEENRSIILRHEFEHFFHLLFFEVNGVKMYCDEISVLHEAMTSKVTDGDTSYSFEKKVLDFFMENTSEFDYHVYNEKGITGLVDEIRAKYPDCDIDYLLDYLDARFWSYYHGNEQTNGILDDETFCDELFKIALDNINKDDIYGAFNSFDKVLSYQYDKGRHEHYYNLYNQELIARGIIQQSWLDLVDKDFNVIVKGDGKIYFLHLKIDEGEEFRIFKNCYGGPSFNFRGTYIAYQMNGDNFKITPITENGDNGEITIQDDYVQFVNLWNSDTDKIIQYASRIGYTGNLTDQEFLVKMAEHFNFFKDITYNKFSNGSIAFDTVTDSMYVEIGYTTNGKLGMILYDGDKRIYGTCDSFVGRTAQLPYEKYIQLMYASYRNESFQHLEDVISPKALDTVSVYLIKYFLPNIRINISERDAVIGENHYLVLERDYQIKEPFKTFIDGREYSMGDIYLHEDFKSGKHDNLKLHISTDKDILICSLAGKNYWFMADYLEEMYFQFFDEVLDKLNIMPVNGVYNFTSEEIAKIIDDFIKLGEKNPNISNVKK